LFQPEDADSDLDNDLNELNLNDTTQDKSDQPTVKSGKKRKPKKKPKKKSIIPPPPPPPSEVVVDERQTQKQQHSSKESLAYAASKGVDINNITPTQKSAVETRFANTLVRYQLAQTFFMNGTITANLRRWVSNYPIPHSIGFMLEFMKYIDSTVPNKKVLLAHEFDWELIKNMPLREVETSDDCILT